MLRPAVAVLLATCLAGCGVGPDVGNLHVVDDGTLIRSAQPSALGLAAMRDRHGVQTVINLNPRTIDEELVTAMALGLDYVPLPTATYGLEREHLVIAIAAVRQAEAAGRTPVLIHCQTGQDRTGAAVAAYRVVEQGWDGESADEELERHRHWTHDLVFAHLADLGRDVADARALYAEAVERTGTVNVVRPPSPWRPTTQPTTRPDGVRRGKRATINSRPGVF